MAAHAKFLFDTNFERSRPAAAAGPRGHDDNSDLLARARSEGHREGVAAGRAEAIREAEETLAARLAHLCQSADAIARDLENERELLRAEAAHLALAAARALVPALVAREPDGELLALFEECVANLSTAPHLAVRVPDTDVAALRQKLEETAYRSGYDGRIVVLADDGLGEGDCRIEWADGGIARDRAAMEAWLTDIIASRYAPPPPLPEAAADTTASAGDEPEIASAEESRVEFIGPPSSPISPDGDEQ